MNNIIVQTRTEGIVLGVQAGGGTWFSVPMSPDESIEAARLLTDAAVEMDSIRTDVTARTRKLTLDDLHATLEDDRHNGWGYACCEDLRPSAKERVDKSIVYVANELGLTYEDLFQWSNSKGGRYLHDGIYGRNEGTSRKAVRRYLNADFIQSLKDEWDWTV